MNILADASLLLGQTLRGVAAEQVTYARGATQRVLPAVRGRTVLEQATESGATLRVATVDWLVMAADFAAYFGLPARGDTIAIVEADGLTHTYEVLPPAAGEQEWRFSGPYRTRLRIHTKETSAA